MGLFVIGKLLNECSKVVGYKIYNSETKKSGLIAKEDILNVLMQGKHEIAGLKVLEVPYQNKNELMSAFRLVESYRLYDVSRVSVVDGWGKVVDKPNVYILIGVYGFGEARQFKCVNGNCHERFIPYTEFVEKLKNKEIVGANYGSRKIDIHKKCRNQIYLD